MIKDVKLGIGLSAITDYEQRRIHRTLFSLSYDLLNHCLQFEVAVYKSGPCFALWDTCNCLDSTEVINCSMENAKAVHIHEGVKFLF